MAVSHVRHPLPSLSVSLVSVPVSILPVSFHLGVHVCRSVRLCTLLCFASEPVVVKENERDYVCVSTGLLLSWGTVSVGAVLCRVRVSVSECERVLSGRGGKTRRGERIVDGINFFFV